jgi:hypothetical protein
MTRFFESPQALALLRVRHGGNFWELLNWRGAPERQIQKLARSLPENHRRALAMEQIAPLAKTYAGLQRSVDALGEEAEGVGDWMATNQLLRRISVLCAMQAEARQEAEAIARVYGLEFEMQLRPNGRKYKEVIRLCPCSCT